MKRMMLAGVLGAVLSAVLVAGGAQAQAPVEPVSAQTTASAHWRGLAETDGQFALLLIEDNHPGAVTAVEDADFQAQIQTARRHLSERLPQVQSYESYSAVMAGMAADFRDGHIWSRPTLQHGSVGWPGLVLARRGGAWVVAYQDANAPYAALKGARLESCDGETAEDWATTRIGLFKADASVEAQRAASANWLFLDQSNPFLKRAQTCVFRTEAGPQSVDLRWRRAPVATVQAAMTAAETRAEVGLSVDAVGAGYWISLGTLGADAYGLADTVEAQAEALRRADWVVIDLRGNGGGDSAISDRIVRALVGEARIAAVTPERACGGAFFRASPENITALKAWGDQVRADRGDAAADDWLKMVANIQAAHEAGEAFWPTLTPCAETTSVEAAGPLTAPASLMAGRLVFVTDRDCFSSCLMAADLLRRVGATQVGEATDLSTRYMEVRTVTLPSGLRNFSTLMKLARGLSDFGPYAPDRVFDGDLNDTAALKAWVIGDVLKAQPRP